MSFLRTSFNAVKTTSIAAAATISGAALTGYAVDRLADTPMPAVSAQQRLTAHSYSTRFSVMQQQQAALDQVTDEEIAAATLINDKTTFATDSILDRSLSERDLANLARAFNGLSQDDGIRYRSYNFDPRTMARRDACLDSVMPVRDRFTYAEKVNSCMIEMTQRAGEKKDLATELGGIFGLGLFGAYAAGKNRGRKQARKPAGKGPAGPV